MLENTPGYLQRLSGRAPLGRRTRKLLVAALVILSIFTLFRITAPLLVSSNVVRESMEQAVAQWTGHDVTIAGVPEIRFWPEPRITLRDIVIRKNTGEGERLLGRVAQLSASFDLLEALIGQPEFHDFQLQSPEIYVLRDATGRLDWANDGRLSRAVRDARPSGSGETLPAGSDAPMGEVRISNGMFEISDLASGRAVRLQAINGQLDWPWLSRGLAIKADAEINGRKLAIDMTSTQPLQLLSGKSGNAAATVQSDLFSGRFDGVADFARYAFLAGDAELTVPDLSATLAWSGVSFAGAERLRSFSIDARLVTNDNVLRFDNLSLSMNDAKATGVLDLLLPADRRPRLTGTLAFDQIDFSGVLAAITPRMANEPATDTGLRALLELDLRLSASQARLGHFRLAETAISVMNTPEQSRIDILDSDFENGRLTGRMATLKGGTAGVVGFKLSVQDADFGNIVKELGLSGPLPSTQGTLDLSLDVQRPLSPETWKKASGTIRFRGGRGVVPGVNIAGIRRLALQKPYFPLSEAGGGSFEFNSIELSADLANGAADIREGKIIGGSETLSLSGIIPYAENSMAMSATVRPASENQNVTPLMVFVGGSWPNPVIWPISQTQAKP